MKYLSFVLIGFICFVKSTEARTLTVTGTFYDNCKLCCGKDPEHPAYGITASGKRASHGTIAVDPKIIPLGSKVKIHGMPGIFYAHDTGGAIKGNRIDIWCQDHKTALRLGVKKLVVTVLPKNASEYKEAWLGVDAKRKSGKRGKIL